MDFSASPRCKRGTAAQRRLRLDQITGSHEINEKAIIVLQNAVRDFLEYDFERIDEEEIFQIMFDHVPRR